MFFDYQSVTARSVASGVEAAVNQGEALIDGVLSVQGERTFDNTLRPFEEAGRLGAVAYGQGPFLGHVALRRSRPGGRLERARSVWRSGAWI